MVSRAGSPRPRAWFFAGLLATTLVAAFDGARHDAVIITGVVAGPLIAAIAATTVEVTLVSAYAIAIALLLGIYDDNFLSGDHLLRVAVVMLASAAAILITWRRERRDEELDLVRPQVADAQHLRLALDSSAMGTWRWDLGRNQVEWDPQLEALYGLPPGSFDNTFETYESLLHPEDRPRVRAAVDDGMQRDVGWNFDHRVVWPDGSVHWLEGRGEPMHDASGEIVGAAGVTINVDQRHALLDAERRAREAAERTSRMLQDLAQITLALAGASTVAQVGDAIVNRTVETMNAKSGYFATVDEQTHELVTRAQSGYPDWVVRHYQRIALDEAVPGCDVIRTGRAIYIESREKRREQFPQYADDPTHEGFVVVPLPPVLGARAVLAFGFSEPRNFSGAERAYLSAVVEACAQALQRATTYEAEQAARQGLRVLLDGSEQLNALNDPDLVADTIVRLAATRIGSWATLLRVKTDGEFERVASVHRDPALTPVLNEVLDRVRGTVEATSVLDSGEPILFHGMNPQAQAFAQANPEAWDILEHVGVGSTLLVPISIAGRNLAVLTVGDADPGRLREADVELAIDLGRRGASALERARLWQASQRQLEAEHHIVELLQRSIVPDRLPELDGVAVAAAYRPAERVVDVGGDWYDAFVAPDGAIVIVVGDVAGHGIQAASLMGRVRNALRAYAIENTDPASILLRLHSLLRAQDAAEMVTAFVARFDNATKVLTWSRAGHPPPLIVGPDGAAHFLDAVNGAPLGAMARPYRSAEEHLAPGSLVVCYTDGLIERRDRILDDGLAWLEARVCEHVDDEVETLCDKLADDPFVSHPAPDDICVLALRTELA